MIANKNAQLAIIKQGEVVNCLVQLSTILTMGLKVTTPPDEFNAIDAPIQK